MKPQILEAMRRVVETEADEDEFAQEVMQTRIAGQNLEDHVKAYLDLLVVEGQKLNKLVDAARAQVGEYGPVSNRAFRKAVAKVVAGHWGNDPMTQSLVNLVSFGDYIW